MARKKYKRQKSKPISKSANPSSENISASRVPKGQISYSGLQTINGRIDEELKYELKFPNSMYTFAEMGLDATVRTALENKRFTIGRAYSNYHVSAGRKETERSKQAAKFLEYCLRNMDKSWLSTINNIQTYNQFGFSIMEKVFTKVKSGEYAGRIGLKRLSPIAQKSVYDWRFDDRRDLIGLRQSTQFLRTDAGNINTLLKLTPDTYIELPREKFMIWSFNSTVGNPEGRSPCANCYIAWKQKVMIEDYECVGVTKDMGGIMELGLPSDIMIKAANDPSSPEAEMVANMKRNAANAHAGEQNYFITPSDVYGGVNGAPEYYMRLKGIEGNGGKQYKTSELINERKKAILDSFGVGFLNVGNDGAGANNLHDGKYTQFDAVMQYDYKFIEEQFNIDLFPQLLAMNGIFLPEDEMPKFERDKIQETSVDEESKSIQRSNAVNAIPKTPAVIRENMRKLGYTEQTIRETIPDDMTQEELDRLIRPDENMQSKSGQGLKEGLNSGTGTKVGTSGGDNSVGNNENGGSD